MKYSDYTKRFHQVADAFADVTTKETSFGFTFTTSDGRYEITSAVIISAKDVFGVVYDFYEDTQLSEPDEEFGSFEEFLETLQFLFVDEDEYC